MKKFFNRMAKQCAAVLLSAALIFSTSDLSAFRGMIAFAFAEETVATVTVNGTTTEYDKFCDAWDVATGTNGKSTITLLKDAKHSYLSDGDRVLDNPNADVTIMLNDQQLLVSSHGSPFTLLNGTLTIDGTTGDIMCPYENTSVVLVKGNAILNLKGGRIDGAHTAVRVEGGTFNMSGGELRGMRGKSLEHIDGEVTLSDGTLNMDSSGGIYTCKTFSEILATDKVFKKNDGNWMTGNDLNISEFVMGAGSIEIKSIPVKITQQPESVALSMDETSTVLSVTAVALSDDQNIEYCWQENGQWVYSARSPQYEFQVTSAENRYRCNIRCDGYIVYSNEVTVTRPSPLKITEQPQGVATILNSSSPVLSVKAEALGSVTDLTYQWYKGSNMIDGATASTYTVPTNKNGEFTYYCNVTCNGFTVKSDVVNVNISALNISLNAYTGKTYDGTALENPTADQVESNVAYDDLTFDWYQDGNKLDANPVNAGDYTLKITAESLTEEFAITIDKKPLTITAKDQAIAYGENIRTGTDQAQCDLANGDSLNSITISVPSDVTSIGTHTDAVTVSDAVIKRGDADVTANYDITYESGDLIISEVAVTVNTLPTASGIKYGQTLSDSTLTGGSASVDGSFAWADGNTKPSAGTNTYSVTFTPTDTNYGAVSCDVEVRVDKAGLTINGATIERKTYNGDKTANVTEVTFNGLVNGESLTLDTDYTATAVFSDANAGTDKTATVTVTLRDTVTNYTLPQNTFTLTNQEIKKASQTLTMLVTSFEKTYGDDAFSLVDCCSTDGDGEITYSTDNASIITVLDDGTATIVGTGDAEITVKLAEGANYTGTDSKTITVTVNKADYPPNKPGNKLNVRNSCEKVSGVELPEGWEWSAADKDKDLVVDVPLTTTAWYTKPDKGNYNNIEVEIEITRSNCGHEQTKIVDAKDATCTESGYTGDTVCADCKVVIKTGTELARLQHEYRSEITTEPTVDDEGVRTYTCKNCGDSYTESIAKLPKPDHQHNYTSAVTKAATCTENGVRTYTCECGDSYTESIPAVGHDYQEKVTKQPTSYREGECVHTCPRCGDSYTEVLPKLDKPTSSGSNGSVRPSRPSRPDRDDTSDAPKPDNTPSAPKPDDTSGESKPGDTLNDPTPGDTDKPYIKGDNGKEGWDVIRAEIDITKDGGEITVEMNGTTEVPGDILNSIMGEDITITFDMDSGVSWSVNGKDVTTAVGNIDFGVKVGSSGIPVDVINNVTGEDNSLQLSLSYDGEFGFTAVLSIELGAESAGCYVSLYYYNEASGDPEFISESKITENGVADLEFTHASDYIVVVNEKSRFDEDDTGESSSTSETFYTSETESGLEDTVESGDNAPASSEGDPADSGESSAASSESDPTEENPKTGVEMPFIAVLIAAASVTAAYVMSRRKKDRQ